MRHFQHHRRNARAALNARLGKVDVDELTHPQVVMFSWLTLDELRELRELSLLGRHNLA